MVKKIDKLHMALLLISGALAVMLWQQIDRAEVAASDAGRYKRFAVWSLDHADAQFSAFAKKSASTQSELEKYLTEDARKKLLESGLLSPVPPLSETVKVAKSFEGSVDLRTFEEVQELRRRAN